MLHRSSVAPSQTLLVTSLDPSMASGNFDSGTCDVLINSILVIIPMTAIAGCLIFALLGAGSTAGMLVFAILYGFFSGGCKCLSDPFYSPDRYLVALVISLIAAVAASYAVDLGEVGCVALGVCLRFSSRLIVKQHAHWDPVFLCGIRGIDWKPHCRSIAQRTQIYLVPPYRVCCGKYFFGCLRPASNLSVCGVGCCVVWHFFDVRFPHNGSQTKGDSETLIRS